MTLALFDIDGTLLLTPDLIAVRAILDAIAPRFIHSRIGAATESRRSVRPQLGTSPAGPPLPHA